MITIEDTRFIFKTNFSGDPSRDTFGSTERKANIILDEETAAMLYDEGFNVKETKPRPDEEEGWEPTKFVAIKANYNSKWPPKIYLVSNGKPPVLLDEETVGELDYCYVENVDVVCNEYVNEDRGTKSLYIRTMYVTCSTDDDPFNEKYR